MTAVSEVTSMTELKRLRPVWNRLLSETPGADFFRTLDWLEVYWQHYGAEQTLKVLVLEDERPTGIVPLVIRTEQNRLGKFRVLTYPLDYWGSLYGPIGANPEGILETALEHLALTEQHWDYIDLRWMSPEANQPDWIADCFENAGMRSLRRSFDPIPMIDLRQGWEQYWKSRSGNWRSNCRRNEKKLRKEGPIQYIRYRPAGSEQGEGDPRWDLYDACEQIARRSWQASSADGTTITHETVRPFLRDMHEVATRTGCVDVNLLYVDEQPVAFNYNYHYRGYVSSLRLGYDAAWGRAGVGTTLTYSMLQDSFARGDHTFDFLPGSLEIKRCWQTSAVNCFRYEHMPWNSSRLQILQWGRWVKSNLQQVISSR